MNKLTIFSLSMVALLGAVSPSLAANRHVTIINKTGMTLKHFYASNAGTSSWEEDILGRDTLANGEEVEVNIDDGTGACKFDFKAVFDNGGSLVKEGVDVCTTSTFTYTK